MPYQYVKLVKPMPRIKKPKLAGMGNLGAMPWEQRKKKKKKQSEEALALMNMRKKEFEEAQMQAEELKVEVEELGKVLGILFEIGKAKGIPEDKLQALLRPKSGLAKATAKPVEGQEKLTPTEQAALAAKAAQTLAARTKGFWSK